MKEKKISRQTVLNNLEACLLVSANVWTEEAQNLYEEILTTPHFDPLPLDAVVSMMYRSAHPVPHATVQTIVALGGKELIASDYQIVSTYWKSAIHNAKDDLLFLRSLGFKVHRIPHALNQLLALKTHAADEAVIEELDQLQTKQRNIFSDRATVIGDVLSAAIANGRVEVLRSIHRENYAIPGFVKTTLIPALLRGCEPSAHNNFSVPGHAFAVTDFILTNLDAVCRKEAMAAIKDEIKMSIIPHTSFNQISEMRREHVQMKLKYLEEVEPLWDQKEYKEFKHFFTQWNLPPLASFQAERIEKAIASSVPSQSSKRKM